MDFGFEATKIYCLIVQYDDSSTNNVANFVMNKCQLSSEIGGDVITKDNPFLNWCNSLSADDRNRMVIPSVIKMGIERDNTALLSKKVSKNITDND